MCHYGIKKISVDKSLKNVSATLAFEGLKPSNTEIRMSKLVLEGKATGLEAREIIFNHYHIKSKSKV